MPLDKPEIIRAIKDERRRTIDLLGGLEEKDFDVEALPGWRVREVLAHLITTDRAAVTGGILPVVFSSMQKLEAWNDRQVAGVASRPPAELVVALDTWGRRFARFAATLPSALYQLRMPTLWGRGPGGLLVFARVYDEWIHRQDIRLALGRELEDADLVGPVEFLYRTVAVNTVPLVKGERGRVAVSLRGVAMPEWGYDLESGEHGPALAAGAAVRIHAAAPRFVMAAAGRGAFGELETDGDLQLEGDADLGRRFLGKLRIV